MTVTIGIQQLLPWFPEVLPFIFGSYPLFSQDSVECHSKGLSDREEQSRHAHSPLAPFPGAVTALTDSQSGLGDNSKPEHGPHI